VKVGDVVKLKEHYRFTEDCKFGIVIRCDNGPDERDSWLSYQVQWGHESLWHGDHELELVSESR